MHGFFANMRGFVLRFNVNAVQTSLEASKPDELGRSLHKLRPGPHADGEPPYYEQDPNRAKIIEFQHCQKYCVARVQHGGPGAHGEKKACGGSHHFEEAINPKHSDRSNRLSVDVGTSIGLGVSRSGGWPPTPIALSRRHTADTLLVTPTTIVGSPTDSTYSPTLLGTPYSPSNHHGFPPRDSTNMSNSSAKEALEPSTGDGSKEGGNSVEKHETWRASWALNSMQIQYAMQRAIIPASPFISHAELKDRSKGDSFIKGFAVLQITALVIQIIARSFQRLDTTLLEITVLAFAACAIVTYILLWHKPQDVKVPVYIDIDKTLSREQIIKLAARAPVATLLIHDFWLHGVSIRAQADNIFPWTPGIKLKLPSVRDPILVSPVVLGIGGGGVLFGAVHFVAWSFTFPTPVERLLWRISCCVLVILPVLGTAFYCMTQHSAKKRGFVDTKVNRSLRPLSYVIGLAYLLARLYISVEVFRALAYPEPSVFKQVNWPTTIPYMD